MPIKIPFGNYPASVYANAINFAVTNNADIISNSWGYGSSNSNLHPVIISAINNAISNNKLVVFAAGNTANRVGGNNGFVSFPANANITDLITVGASDRNNNQANYSPNGQALEVSAPSHTAYNSQITGESFNIWTIDAPNTNQGYNSWKDSWAGLPAVGEILPNNGTNFSAYTGRMGGTSAATPIVAGVLALMKSVNSCLNISQLKNILQNTADKIGGFNYDLSSTMPGHSIQLGYGKVNAYNAVSFASNYNSPTLDLYVKDSYNDTGAEPNTVTPYMWVSSDIWVRNFNDNGLTHQNPDYSANGNDNYVKVRVINKSCVASTGNEELRVYWAKASTNLGYPNPWYGGIPHPITGANMGDHFGTLTIPALQPGEEAILTFPWLVPNPANYGTIDQWHFCLLARIVATNDPMTFPETGDLNANVRNNNNIAWKNVTVVDILPNNRVNPGGVVAVGNSSDRPRRFFLELEAPNLEEGRPIFQEAEVSITMDNVLYRAWRRGGGRSRSLNPSLERGRLIVEGNNAILDNILINADQIATLRLDFNFLTEELTDKTTYTYHVIQKDAETGEIIGGETFTINKNPRDSFEADAGGDKEVNLNESITINAEDINEPAIYNWYDSRGNLVYQGKDLQISSAVAEKFKLEVISTVDGFKDYTEVEVKIKPNKPNTLENIAPNPASNNVVVSYNLNGASSAYLMVIGYYGSNGTSNNYILDVNSSEINLNVSNYPNGLYTVALVVNGKIVDATTLIKQ